ncbi:glycosyltransferase family 2 protein [Spirosoma aerophilum]
MAEGECVTSFNRSNLVSIITINFNQAEITRQFLESSKSLKYPNYEIIVIDNGSTDPFHDSINCREFPNLKLIRSETNLGFTGGNNLGMDEAKGDYFFIVNNDTELSPWLLNNLLNPFFENPEIGVVCPKIRFFDSPQLIQYAGYNPINMFTGTATSIGFNEVDNGQFDEPHPTSFAHGCAMMIRREVVDRVGRFAERFFLYYE